jgi:hypothetical protein
MQDGSLHSTAAHAWNARIRIGLVSIVYPIGFIGS